MTAWKKLPNRYDINLEEPYDINSARNNEYELVSWREDCTIRKMVARTMLNS